MRGRGGMGMPSCAVVSHLLWADTRSKKEEGSASKEKVLLLVEKNDISPQNCTIFQLSRRMLMT